MLALASAGLYTFIALGPIEVISTTGHTHLKQLAFALPAAVAHLILFALVVRVDWRLLWGIAAAAQGTALTMYVDLARVREPAYEPWGVTLAALQFAQLLLLAFLILRPPVLRARHISHVDELRILVAHGSRHHATKETAETIAAVLRDEGFTADLRAATEVDDVTVYDAVVLGGALYVRRWHRDARRFVRRHRDALVVRPLWLFSCGPLDDSASRRTIPPVASVERTVRTLRANGHMTFGGRLERGVGGPLTRAVARQRSGDWRDQGHVEAWAHGIADSLRSVAEANHPRHDHGDRTPASPSEHQP